MRQRSRGWIMPEADMLSMLKLIDEKTLSPKIEVEHRDVLIRLREIFENDLNADRFDDSSNE
ncbi:hypothetical protein [Microvirga aerophila]|uniref:Uncharacterized protein n=1 Tax=Microvirga aerophila TaxID=670291 RepID=A0A512BVS7_9HYPH|nr:hypothetical protein [Microvirga aerophila]GEO16056.1 hypothetical protein MAE02_37520 [Microvirga aerophila]